jgi:excisionase family DNA binding protein
MRKTPPRKRAGRPTGPRRLDGAVLDVATMARELGATEKTIRAQLARGLLPYRRLGARVIFVRAEVQEFLRRLPGVGLDEAIANVQARGAAR